MVARGAVGLRPRRIGDHVWAARRPICPPTCAAFAVLVAISARFVTLRRNKVRRKSRFLSLASIDLICFGLARRRPSSPGNRFTGAQHAAIVHLGGNPDFRGAPPTSLLLGRRRAAASKRRQRYRIDQRAAGRENQGKRQAGPTVLSIPPVKQITR